MPTAPCPTRRRVLVRRPGRASPSRTQGMSGSHAHLPRAPTDRRWADPVQVQSRRRAARPSETSDCSPKSGQRRAFPETVGGAPEGTSIRRAQAARGHVPKTAASKSGRLIEAQTTGCPAAAGESERRGHKQLELTGRKGRAESVSRHRRPRRGKERRLDSQSCLRSRSEKSSHICRWAGGPEVHHLFSRAAYSGCAAFEWM